MSSSPYTHHAIPYSVSSKYSSHGSVMFHVSTHHTLVIPSTLPITSLPLPSLFYIILTTSYSLNFFLFPPFF
jgi:hypothetical protein